MNEFVKQTTIAHLKKFFGESCIIDPRFRSIKNIEYIRIGKVLIFTNDVKYDDETEYYYFFFGDNKKIVLKNENIFRVYIKELKVNMYAILLCEHDFITSNNVHLQFRRYPKNYRDEYKVVFELAAYQNYLNYTITKPKKLEINNEL